MEVAACQAAGRPEQTWMPMDSLPRAIFTTTFPVARWRSSATNQSPKRLNPPPSSLKSAALSQCWFRVGNPISLSFKFSLLHQQPWFTAFHEDVPVDNTLWTRFHALALSGGCCEWPYIQLWFMVAHGTPPTHALSLSLSPVTAPGPLLLLTNTPPAILCSAFTKLQQTSESPGKMPLCRTAQ